ncbi:MULTISPECIES: sigma 54-interacting transcriptional regulator [unclassified Clostridioides]|uniref:sigma 54-interacting transcriptional regulator n=1 Tax=unclassified Clostridioides TaxID=2635829 RepID=UPI001D11ADAE|nr:sigma 54-interacting transcriptional regulator [Clostridioides sp. ZZV15-6388]MCC0645145.1 sigma 54-interacting transcriptional regulator [Clostridioides sp. ZZV14-6150]MCC0661249.1 sigma 54-interacting transcriptional regulator [Clostridioides sp. ZZV14-6154]MCC0663153.1 sigma 54-interacting transcriptional regulator [Clostridioides sp. ZZV15-6597]MCC0719487.1 sigma 54-interacting transcriptional regulator [Clostridioides sp. ZZV14-6105]WLD26906.1 Anaerobic nitric oxide reductase transcrip
MKNEIVVIAPSKLFSDTVYEVLEELHIKIPSYIATGKETIELADNLINLGTKVIITRGQNVDLLRKHVSIPIVDIGYKYEDIFYSYKKALKYSSKIGFIGLELSYKTAKRFKEISNFDLEIPKLNSLYEFEDTIKELIDNGTEIFIGGKTTKEITSKYNKPCIETEVEKSSIHASINEAIHLYNIGIEKRINNSITEEILECTHSGIIAIDKNHSPLFINNQAKRLLFNQVDKFIKDYLTSGDISDSLKNGHSLCNNIINFKGSSLTFDCFPIIIDSLHFGCVATIQDIENIQSTEKEIRESLISKSHCAKSNFNDILGSSDALMHSVNMAKKFAKSDSTIIITGESGTGKEIFAQSIHNYSNRFNGPFVAINCAAIPENILESELFGYVKGAFTGARNEGKAGVFELAHNGTIFLDEIGEISKDVQVKLLRVLQEREVTRIGDTKVVPINVRVITATNKNLVEQIDNNNFREDLFYRLCVLKLDLPPLRERKEDIEQLTYAIISHYNKPVSISDSALKILSRYDFPGNIRQLKNIVERLVVMCDDNFIDEYLVSEILTSEPHFRKDINSTSTIDYSPTLADNKIVDYEKKLILETLEKNNGVKSVTASQLGISTTTLWRKLKKYQLSN